MSLQDSTVATAVVDILTSLTGSSPMEICSNPTWSNYSDLARPHPKWWFSKGNPLISGKSRLVKYNNLARSHGPWRSSCMKWQALRFLNATTRPGPLKGTTGINDIMLPCLKLTAKAPANRPSQKEGTQPSIFRCENVSFREGN